MVSRKRLRAIRARQEAEKLEAFKQVQAKGSVIYRRLYELSQSEDRSRLAETVLKMLRYTQSQTAAARQAIADRDKYDFFPTFESEPLGDVATTLAEDIAGVMRDNVTNSQTIWQAMTDQFPDVHFTVDWYNAVSMVASILREQYLAGVIEGLELAGVQIPKPDRDFD
jgi:hypothetical protein